MDPYKTVYKKDYVPLKMLPITRAGTKQEFQDPIREGFKNYLQLSCIEPPAVAPVEDADSYLEKVKERYPKVGKIYYEKPINNEVIKEQFIYNGRTVYQVDFCDLVKDEEYKAIMAKKNALKLPDDWYIPLTTQKSSYRVPTTLYSKALERCEYIKAPTNLDPEEHIREILKVKCGRSEYQKLIGKLGDYIVNEQLHGKIVHPPCTCLLHHKEN